VVLLVLKRTPWTRFVCRAKLDLKRALEHNGHEVCFEEGSKVPTPSANRSMILNAHSKRH
jgi:hypothetical protein